MSERTEPHKRPYRVETIIFDLARQEQIAFLDCALWIPTGSVIELGSEPNRDAVVLGTRIALPSFASFAEEDDPVAHIIVDVEDPRTDMQDFIPRHPADRLPRD